MAKPNHKNMFTYKGRLLQHPAVFDNRDGSKTVLMHIACETDDWDAEKKSYAFDDVELRAYVPADRIGKDARLWAVKGSQVSGNARYESRQVQQADGSVVTMRSMNVYEFELDDTKAETDARLQRYAANGDQRAAALLAERQGEAVQAQAPQQPQAQPVVDNSWVELDDTKAETDARLTHYAQDGDQRAAALLAERQGVQAPAAPSAPAAAPVQQQVQQAQAAPQMPTQAQVQQAPAPTQAPTNTGDPFDTLFNAMQAGQASPAQPQAPQGQTGQWGGAQNTPAPEWATA